MIVVQIGRSRPSLRFAYFSPERQRLHKQIEDVLPGRIVDIVSKSADSSRAAVVTSSPQNLPLLHLVNVKSGRIDVLAEAYPALNGTRLAEVRRHTYAAHDGSTLTGLLTLPAQSEDRNLPLVALPAGGFGCSIDAFDWFAQFLARRGYAVFQAGARNLKELGEFEGMDDFGSWMSAAQDDIASGIDDLIAKGIADPKRICIVGADTGGYVALSATIFVPGKYACAINFAGLSDLSLIMRGGWYFARSAQNVFNSMLLRNRYEYSDEDLHDFSPARRADAVSGSVLLIFSDRERAQGDKMNEALIGAHKSVEYITLRDEDGTLSRTESRVALLNAVDKFLAAHIGR